MNGIERADSFALAAAGTGFDVINHRMLHPILWFKALQMKGTGANATTTSGALSGVDHWDGMRGGHAGSGGVLSLLPVCGM